MTEKDIILDSSFSILIQNDIKVLSSQCLMQSCTVCAVYTVYYATKGLILIYFDMDMQIMPVKLLMLFYTIRMVYTVYT